MAIFRTIYLEDTFRCDIRFAYQVRIDSKTNLELPLMSKHLHGVQCQPWIRYEDAQLLKTYEIASRQRVDKRLLSMGIIIIIIDR